MSRILSHAAVVLVLATSVVVFGTASAVDGVLEINNASVLSAGGYPALITTPGSYVLTGSLTPPPGVDGIAVLVSDVTIDLNGFSITGGPGAPASGVAAAGFTNVTVRNGTISGFGGAAIAVGPAATVMKTRIYGNLSGIAGGYNCLIVENVIQVNGGGNGIDATHCKIENNVVADNGGVGIAGATNIIVHNEISNNAAGGIFTFGGSTIQSNVLAMNGGFGISDGAPFPPPPFPGLTPPPPGPPERNVIIGNTIHGTFGGPGVALMLPAVIRDNSISSNFADGVICGADCAVQGNTIESNNLGGLGAGGITVFAGSSVTNNSISDNFGYGLALPVTAGFSNNTFNANGGPDVLVLGGPIAHPTAGFFNLCSGIPGPVPGLCP